MGGRKKSSTVGCKDGDDILRWSGYGSSAANIHTCVSTPSSFRSKDLVYRTLGMKTSCFSARSRCC